jgi:hypothetical protein
LHWKLKDSQLYKVVFLWCKKNNIKERNFPPTVPLAQKFPHLCVPIFCGIKPKKAVRNQPRRKGDS